MHKDDYLPETAFAEVSWQKSTASEPQKSCVEFAKVGNVIAIRDSKVPGGPILQFNEHEIAAMLDGVKAGEFDHFI